MNIEHSSYGLCQCGCGERTAIAEYTCRRHGWVKGEPKKWMPYHWRRHAKDDPGYKIEDRGFKTPCWIWQRFIQKGYGRMYRPERKRAGLTPTVLAHKWIWEDRNGPVPDGMDLDHLCRNRSCVNPDHLEPVSRAENILRGVGTPLTRERVIYLRTEPNINIQELSREWGISDRALYAARRGERWKSLNSLAPPVPSRPVRKP